MLKEKGYAKRVRHTYWVIWGKTILSRKKRGEREKKERRKKGSRREKV
jgi:hypothetical protein